MPAIFFLHDFFALPPPGSFDSSVHISEEASNAATAVPWAIVLAIGIAGVLGTGMHFCVTLISANSLPWPAVNIVLAFCMGTDLEGLMETSQPMAAIFYNAFGKRGTLALWSFVVIIQCVRVG